MAIDLISIGNRIKFYRLQRKWTLERMADETGVSLQMLARVERGERSCSLNTLIQIANALQLPADELLVDNLVYTNSQRDGDEYYTLLDCTPEETAILVKNMKSLKEILHKYTIK